MTVRSYEDITNAVRERPARRKQPTRRSGPVTIAFCRQNFIAFAVIHLLWEYICPTKKSCNAPAETSVQERPQPPRPGNYYARKRGTIARESTAAARDSRRS